MKRTMTNEHKMYRLLVRKIRQRRKKNLPVKYFIKLKDEYKKANTEYQREYRKKLKIRRINDGL
jgi:hypothetical protein